MDPIKYLLYFRLLSSAVEFTLMYKSFLHLVGMSNDINPTYFDRFKKKKQLLHPGHFSGYCHWNLLKHPLTHT